MVIPPVPGCIKTAGPDAGATLASGRLLGPVPTGGNGQPLRHHDGTEVAAAGGAGGQEAPVLVRILGPTLHGAAGQQCCHPIARRAPAGPGPAIRPITILGQFRRVEAEQTDARLAQPETVAVAGARLTGNRWQGLIKHRREQRGGGQNDNCQHGSAPTAKERKTIQLPTPDFTAR